jgi:hypothetical protein
MTDSDVGGLFAGQAQSQPPRGFIFQRGFVDLCGLDQIRLEADLSQ